MKVPYNLSVTANNMSTLLNEQLESFDFKAIANTRSAVIFSPKADIS